MLHLSGSEKRIQTFAWLVGLWIGWVGHYPTFAVEPCTDLVQQNDFFGKNAQSVLHIGIKSWAKGTKKIIEKHWAIGSEIAIGPVVEWHPFNGIGFQTGLFYNYNCLFTVDFSVDRKRLLDTSLFSFGYRVIDVINSLSAKDEGYIVHAGLGSIAFHAMSLPLFFRLYPEKSRKLICYGGLRFILIFPDLQKKQYCSVHIDTSIIKNTFYGALKRGSDIANQRNVTVQDIQDIARQGLSNMYHSIFRIKPDRAETQPLSNKLCIWDLGWDFGFEFRGDSGIVIGINGLGLVLGYDFFVK